MSKVNISIGPAPPLTAGQRDADMWAEQLRAERLPRLRALGEKWQSTASTLIAFFGAGSIIGADEAIRALPAGARIAYGLFILATIVFAVFAVYFASCVSEGGIESIPDDVNGRLALREQLVTNAICSVRKSKQATIIAIVLLIFAQGVRWFMPVPATTTADHARPETSSAEKSKNRSAPHSSHLKTGPNVGDHGH